VTITITNVNDDRWRSTKYTTAEDTVLIFSAGSVTNDLDADGDAFTA